MFSDKAFNYRKPALKHISVYPTQMQTQSLGQLRIRCATENEIPVSNATISISSPSDPTRVIEELRTDESGITEPIELPTPPRDYSLAPNEPQPYSEYDLSIVAEGYETEFVSGVQILPDVVAEQNAQLEVLPLDERLETQIVIPPHTLYGEFPPKIPEDEIKPTAESGAIVLNQVVVPEFVIVHDGPPTDASASNYYVRFRDYIKNVASSEIYATWPESTLYANVLAILSFTLNRVFTEWYPNQGYNFTITSSTAYDHKWSYGRNIYSNIAFVVDSVFNNYLSRPNVKQPILTQYCDGVRTSCPGWMTQWGSKDLGDQGLSAIEILRRFYGNDIFINTAVGVAGVPQSWSGTNLTIGSRGNDVRTIQEQLNRIAQVYTAIPRLTVDGIYGQQTAEAVRSFQRIFSLPVTGVVDKATWYRISGIYVAVARLAS